jgi:2-(1,2-epoxy-1,2-dihydrophenyl)acetyl-CoA isomerase
MELRSFTTINVEVEDGLATLTLNRPEKLNALNDQMAEEFVAAFRGFQGDPAIRAVVLTGAGRGFCSGADISGGSAVAENHEGHRASDGRRHLLDALQRMPLAIRSLEKPVIAAVNGIAAGGGLDLACACDIRCASSAARFTEIFAKRGLFPGTGGCYLLPRIVGTAKAAEMIWTGAEMNADEALKCGLVSYVMPEEDFLKSVKHYCRRFVEGPPIAMGLAKATIYVSENLDFATSLNYAATAESITLTSRDREEGALAFRERRAPKFVGR